MGYVQLWLAENMLRSAQAPVELKPAAPTIAGRSSEVLTEDSPANFDWPLVNKAEQLLRRHVHFFLQRNSFARGLEQRMREETATDLFEWIDHLALSASEEDSLRQAG